MLCILNRHIQPRIVMEVLRGREKEQNKNVQATSRCVPHICIYTTHQPHQGIIPVGGSNCYRGGGGRDPWLFYCTAVVFVLLLSHGGDPDIPRA